MLDDAISISLDKINIESGWCTKQMLVYIHKRHNLLLKRYFTGIMKVFF